MPDIGFSCPCGTVKGHVIDARPETGLHIACFCESCRIADIHGGFPDPAPDPVDLYQVPSHRIVFDQGADLIAPFKVKPKGVLRWQATCCGTLLGNTPDAAKIPLFALQTRLADDMSVFGPVRSWGFVPQTGGGTKHKGLLGFAHTIARMFVAVLNGNWKRTPFFDPITRKPVTEATVMRKEDQTRIRESFAKA